MSKKNIYVLIGVALLFLVIGYFSGRKYHGVDEHQKTVDSLLTVDAERDRNLNMIILGSNKKIQNSESKLKENEINYKKDSDRIYDDDELLRLKESINSNLEQVRILKDTTGL